MSGKIKDKNDLKATERAMTAIRALSARCDGATSKDGAGFSGTDVPVGHALAAKSVWSAREVLAATRLIVKYKKQLAKYSIDVSGVDVLKSALELELDSDAQEPLSKRDIVKGRIWVDKPSGQIVLKIDYHNEIKRLLKEMLGSQWDASRKQWLADLCAENATTAEYIAQTWGIQLERHAGWKKLVSVRRVEIKCERLIIHGVRAWAVIKSIPSLSGKPSADEQFFGALQVVDELSIAIPLRSWVIREAILWLEIMGQYDANFERLGWARNEAIQLLQKAYAGSLIIERDKFTRASAIVMSSDTQVALRASLPTGVSNRLMPHQWVAVNAIVEHHEIILADQQGLGKTIEILAALEAVQAYPAVVIAPATALLNWRDEVVSWLPNRRVSVLGGGVGKREQGVPISEADIVIINYDSFAKHADALVALQPQALIADEVQNLKGHDSARTNAVKQFCKVSKVERIVVASGTPVMNRPSELLAILTLLPSLLVELGGFGRFASRYCQATLHLKEWSSYWDYGGAAHLGELANRLRETGRFIRREKAAVLPRLAAKELAFLNVEISNRSDYEQAKENFSAWLKNKNNPRRNKIVPNRAEDSNESVFSSVAASLGWNQDDIDTLHLERDEQAEAIRRVNVLRQLAGVGKIAAAINWIYNIVKDEKLVVFAYHLEVQTSVLEALSSKGIHTLSITGAMTPKARRDAILKFQTDVGTRLIVCSLKASQTAITLTAARHVLMIELDWTPSALEQAEDRVHRIGQNRQVQITYMHALNTLDDRMVEILDGKRAKIGILGASNAPHGYRKDGTPRKQASGPGRPSLPSDERAKRRKSSKSGWQERNSEYMREYMRKDRLKRKIKLAKLGIEDYLKIERLGREGMLIEMYGQDANRFWNQYKDVDFARDLAEARKIAEIARSFLNSVKDINH